MSKTNDIKEWEDYLRSQGVEEERISLIAKYACQDATIRNKSNKTDEFGCVAMAIRTLMQVTDDVFDRIKIIPDPISIITDKDIIGENNKPAEFPVEVSVHAFMLKESENMFELAYKDIYDRVASNMLSHTLNECEDKHICIYQLFSNVIKQDTDNIDTTYKFVHRYAGFTPKVETEDLSKLGL